MPRDTATAVLVAAGERGAGWRDTEGGYAVARGAVAAIGLLGVLLLRGLPPHPGPALAYVALAAWSPIPAVLGRRLHRDITRGALAIAVTLVDFAFVVGFNVSFPAERNAGIAATFFVILEATWRFGLAGSALAAAAVTTAALRWPLPGLPDGTARTTSVVEGVLCLTLGALAARAIVRRSLVAVSRARELFQVAFDNSPTGLALLDDDGRVVRANTALRGVLETTDVHLTGQRLADLVPTSSDGTGDLAAAVQDVLDGHAPGRRVEISVGSGETERWLLATATPLSSVERRGGHSALVQFLEVTEQRMAQRDLDDRTKHDPLTGLGNRLLLFQWLERSARSGLTRRTSVLYCDLDKFKWINDTLGHMAGDLVLVEVARRLKALVRPGDLVTRVGGDEFVIVLPDVSLTNEAEDVAERVVAMLREPIVIDGHDVVVHGSVGISMPSDTPDDPESRVADADTAMYRAKQGGGNRVALFTPPMRQARELHAQTDSALRDALRVGALELRYQPVVNLRTGQFDGVEALLRWPGHNANIQDAIAVAEESDLIVLLGEWVLRQALSDNPGGSLCVNVSVRQLIRPQFASAVRRGLREAGVSPEQLCIEVTETSFADNIEAVVAALRELRETGVRVAIDDFGTGHASLTYLARFPVDLVKVDRSFVQGLGNDAACGVIVRSVAAMAHALGMKVIAEGVENLNQLELVLEAGCDAAQGYLFSRPLSRQKCVETLANAVPWPVGFSGARERSTAGATTPTVVDPALRYRLLLDLARDITGRLDLAEVLAATFIALRQLFTFGGGSIQLLDASGDYVRLAAADPAPTPDAYETRIPVGQGIGGRIVASGEPRYIPDILLDPDVPSWRATSAGVRSYLGVPLITEGAVIGVLQIDSPEVDPFTEEDRFTLLAFTPMVAAAIQTARLFEREAADTLLPRQRPAADDSFLKEIS